MGFQLDQTARQRSSRLRLAVAAFAIMVSAGASFAQTGRDSAAGAKSIIRRMRSRRAAGARRRSSRRFSSSMARMRS